MSNQNDGNAQNTSQKVISGQQLELARFMAESEGYISAYYDYLEEAKKKYSGNSKALRMAELVALQGVAEKLGEKGFEITINDQEEIEISLPPQFQNLEELRSAILTSQENAKPKKQVDYIDLGFTIAVLGILCCLVICALINYLAEKPEDEIVPPTIDAGTIEVLGTEQNGHRFDCPVTGSYTITIAGGAYSPWSGIGKQWRTILYIYINMPVEWADTSFGVNTPTNNFTLIGRSEQLNDTREYAEDLAKGDAISVDCQAGQFLLFVPIDVKVSYSDNQGGVLLSISYIAANP